MMRNIVLAFVLGFLFQMCNADQPKVELNKSFEEILVQFEDRFEVQRFNVFYRELDDKDTVLNVVQVMMFEPTRMPQIEVDIKQLCFDVASQVFQNLNNKEDFEAIQVSIVSETLYLDMAHKGDSYKFTFEELNSKLQL